MWYHGGMSTLDEQQITDRLADLEGWSYADGAIHRSYEFDGFPDAIDFITRIAEHAEAANHHPDLRNSYTSVEVSLTTHSEGGVTDKDLALARKIEDEADT